MNEIIERVYDQSGNRFYQVTRDGEVIAKLPSVTTILGGTSDKSGLEAWRQRVGEEEADRIGKLSANRGTIMHRLVELYKSHTEGEPLERLEKLKELASEDDEVNQFKGEEQYEHWLEEGWKMFMKFFHNHADYFDSIKKVMSAEEFLWTTKKGGWAGTVDNVSELVNNMIKIIDYKNSRKPKRDEWIQDYYLQASAYWMAYWDMTGVKADGAEIWIANEVDDIPQKFTLTETDLKFYLKEFIKRREKFNELHGV